MHLALPRLIAATVTAHGGTWTGTSAALHRALLDHGGPDVGAVPVVPARLTAALYRLAADPTDTLRVDRQDDLGRWLVRTGVQPTEGTAALTRVWRSDDGALLGLATCSSCSRDVLHGLGHDPTAPLLGERVPHCRCGLRTYQLTDPSGLVAA